MSAWRHSPGRVVLVSNEVGSGVHPETRAGRIFADELGRLNTALAAHADEVVLMVAGLPLWLRPGRRASGRPSRNDESGARPSQRLGSRRPHRGVRCRPRWHGIDYPDDGRRAGRPGCARTQLTKPAGALGMLEELSIWAAGVQGQCPPHAFERTRVVVFAGDHGITAAGVSAYPAEVTAQMVANIAAGGAAVNVLADAAGAGVRVLDLSVARRHRRRPCRGTRSRRSSGRIDREDALSPDEAERALAAGAAVADDEIDSGAQLLIAGDMGIGNTTPASVLISVLTGTEPIKVVGRGTGIDDAGWIRKMRRRPRRPAPGLAAPGGPGPAAGDRRRRGPGGDDRLPAAGRGAPHPGAAGRPGGQRRRPGRAAGPPPGGALAARRAPVGRARPRAGPAPVGADPILQLGMRLGEGTGALVALPVLRAATLSLARMATFAEAAVATRERGRERPVGG